MDNFTSEQFNGVSAEEIAKTVKEQYKVEVERLKLFNARWNAFVNKTVKADPSDETRK